MGNRRHPKNFRIATLALALLAVSAAALQFEALAQKAETEINDPAVAIVGSHVIRESDVQRAIHSLTLGDQIDVRTRRARFIDSLVREEILFQLALDEMRNDPDLRRHFKALIVGDFIEKRIRSKADVSEEQARAYYEATKGNLGGEHVYLRDIRFVDEATCNARLKEIRTVEDFARVAKNDHVLRDIGEAGGEIGTVMTRHVAFGYGDKLKGLKEGKPHKIMHEGSCHIVWLSERTVQPVPTFEELRDRLIAGLKAGAEAELLQDTIKMAQNRIGITRFGKTEEEEIANEAPNREVATAEPVQPKLEPKTVTPARPEPGIWQLTSHNGETVTNASLSGKPAVVTFGFTHCPEICPTTLLEMSQWIGLLKDKAANASWSFVSVDPERDTADVLKRYLSSFSERITGLTGTPEQLASLAAKYDITVRRVAMDDDYTMDHTSSVFLLSEEGKIVDTIPYGTEAEKAVAKIEKFLNEHETTSTAGN